MVISPPQHTTKLDVLLDLDSIERSGTIRSQRDLQSTAVVSYHDRAFGHSEKRGFPVIEPNTVYNATTRDGVVTATKGESRNMELGSDPARGFYSRLHPDTELSTPESSVMASTSISSQEISCNTPDRRMPDAGIEAAIFLTHAESILGSLKCLMEKKIEVGASLKRIGNDAGIKDLQDSLDGFMELVVKYRSAYETGFGKID